jgi:hypothetical protein
MTDETRRCTAISLAGQLATAPDLAEMFQRLYPGETETTAAYLAAVERMRQVCEGRVVQPTLFTEATT